MANLMIHKYADVQSKRIGRDTKIWQFVVVLPGAKIGVDCNICSHCFIENDVAIGDRVTIKNNVQIWDGVEIGNDVFIGPNATFSNDLHPKSKNYPTKFLKTKICDGASVGGNATILPGVTVGSGAMIGAGAVVTKNVPANAIVVGNPAVIIGYTESNLHKLDLQNNELIDGSTDVIDIGVGGSTLYLLPLVPDLRGNLSVAEYGKNIPFVPKRCFWVFNVPNREIRGEHAHIAQHQYLVCVKGSVSVLLDDGENRRNISLDRPNIGLYLPPLVWGVQYKYSDDAVLLVMASDVYDPDDYLRNYNDFVVYANKKKLNP